MEVNLRRALRGLVPLVAALAVSAATTVSADPINLLTNGNFAMIGPNGTSTIRTGQDAFDDAYNLNRYVGPPSAAAGWGVWHNTNATTTTTLEPSPWPGSPYMIHVVTTGTNNGLLQSFLPYNSGPNTAVGSATVYVNEGQIAIGIGNGLYTNFDSYSTTTGAWETISAGNGASPANEFVVYSAGGPADFYVGAASVSTVPEPATLLLLGSGSAACFAAYRRRRARADRPSHAR